MGRWLPSVREGVHVATDDESAWMSSIFKAFLFLKPNWSWLMIRLLSHQRLAIVVLISIITTKSLMVKTSRLALHFWLKAALRVWSSHHLRVPMVTILMPMIIQLRMIIMTLFRMKELVTIFLNPNLIRGWNSHWSWYISDWRLNPLHSIGQLHTRENNIFRWLSVKIRNFLLTMYYLISD